MPPARDQEPIQAWGLSGAPQVSQKFASGPAADPQRGQAVLSKRPQFRQKAAPSRLVEPQVGQVMVSFPLRRWEIV